MGKPKISIVITLYNLGSFITECINSIGDFDKDEVEVIIVNDGSTEEDTLKVLDSLRTRNDINILDQENGGVANARNNGILMAKSDYILSVDADNLITQDYYLKGIELLDAQPSVGAVYSDVIVFGEKEERRKLSDFNPNVFFGVNYIDNCALFRKSIWESIGGYDEKMPISGYEDWDFWMGVYESGYQLIHIPEFLFHYRVRKNSMITDTNESENRLANLSYLINKHNKSYKKHGTEVLIHLTKNVSELENELVQSVEYSKQVSDERLNLLDELEQSVTYSEQVIEEKNRISQQLEHSNRTNFKLQIH